MGVSIDPETEDLWGIHVDGSDYKIVKYTNYGPNHEVKVSNSIITNLLNISKPADWAKIINGYFYVFNTVSGYGPIAHKLPDGPTIEVEGADIQVSQPTDDSVGKLSQLVALGESGFLVRDSSNNHYTWKINQYEHIKDASLSNESLANAAITTNYWKENFHL